MNKLSIHERPIIVLAKINTNFIILLLFLMRLYAIIFMWYKHYYENAIYDYFRIEYNFDRDSIEWFLSGLAKPRTIKQARDNFRQLIMTVYDYF